MPQNLTNYLQDFELLKKNYTHYQTPVAIPHTDLVMRAVPFASKQVDILYGTQKAVITKNFASIVCKHTIPKESLFYQMAMLSDAEVADNKHFKYWIIGHPALAKKPNNKIIVLFHGLNEKDWTKYLPWAKYLAIHAEAQVVLFPIAFHIDRGLKTWQHPRSMTTLSQERQRFMAGIEHSSFVNVALSMRLSLAPQRFFLSGLQTYQDFIDWVIALREGQNMHLSPTSSIHFIGYSAGAFLSLILLMANRQGLFEHSKALLFCGGSLLTGMQLSSKYIMDSQAYEAIRQFYTQDFEQHLAQDQTLKYTFEQANVGGLFFRSMLTDEDAITKNMRLDRLAQLQRQVAYVALQQDDIISPNAIQQTFGDLAIKKAIFQPEHEHSHVIPFVPNPNIAPEVNQTFEEVMRWITNFMNESI